jgi:hypothetical protein
VDMYLTHIGTRIWSPLINIYSKKWIFFAPKTLLYPLSTKAKFIFSNFECYDLANNKK